MPNTLLIHPQTQAKINRFLENTPHAILITGAMGSGKATLANYLAATLLGVEQAKLNDYPHFYSVEPENNKKEISIEQIRKTLKVLTLQATGRNKIRRIIVINNAGLMTSQAQNTLLKALEEPPEGTVYILTSERKSKVLPTIASRSTELQILPVSKEESLEYFNQHEKAEIEKAWVLSQGSVGLMQSLLNKENDELKNSISLAKDFLKLKPYERLLELEAISKDKQEFENLLEGLTRVARAMQRVSAEKQDVKLTQRFGKSLKILNQMSENLDASVSPKIESLVLALNLNI